MNSYIEKKILKYKDNSVIETIDYIAVEKKLQVVINGKEIVSFFCTPLQVRELVIGFLLTEGILKGHFCAESLSINYGDEITVNITLDGEIEERQMTITSGCVGGVTFSAKKELNRISDNFVLNAETLKKLFIDFNQRAELFRMTGCVHGAAIADRDGIIYFSEDIGRHNAVDKIIGCCILENIPFPEKILMASGRLSSEIVTKAGKWGIPVISSRTSPTSRAVEIAEKAGITLVGFVRGDRFNIYSNSHRIKT
ncbi:MAG: formate dehydrogenase accessory sulfurtransferase FdhD [Nitrospirae bacterium]|jgi:FdhD protein|nr:formate dehydrogenase accessory sulfurtransferase FdhD [Nitrospirota bacterium]